MPQEFINSDALLKQATEALAQKEFSKAESLQRQALELLTNQNAEESRISNELEKLTGIHFAAGQKSGWERWLSK